MRGLAYVAAAALTLGLVAGCGGGTSVPPFHPAAVTGSSPAPAATAPVYSDSYACWAFHQAITKGVPASAAGQDTMGWLQGQLGNASPAVYAAMQRFINAWAMADPGKISRSQRAVKTLCAGS